MTRAIAQTIAPDSASRVRLSLGMLVAVLLLAWPVRLLAQDYSDDHEDGSLDLVNDWMTVNARTWTEVGGVAQPQDASANNGFLVRQNTDVADGSFSATLDVSPSADGSTLSRYGGMVFRFVDATHFYLIYVQENMSTGTTSGNCLYLLANTTNPDIAVGTDKVQLACNLNLAGMSRNYPIRVDMSGSDFTVFLNGAQVATFSDARNASGSVGYAHHGQWSREVQFASSSLSGSSGPAPDVTAPTIQSLSPADNAVHVAAGQPSLQVTFDEAVAKGAGNIVLFDSDGNTVETIDVTGAKVSLDASNTIATISPDAILALDKAYYVQIAAGAFADLAGNDFAGISDATSWNFQVNRNPTALLLSATSFSESTASGTTIATLSATDPDGAETFTYALVSGAGATDNASFTISGSDLRTAATVDYETKNSYTIRLQVSDGHGGSFEQAFALTVTNLNDNTPVFAGTSATIAENAAVGTQVAALSATDADGDALAWSIVSGNTNSDFALNASTGIITVAKALDFETTPAYTLLVRASDGTHNTDANITITITDVNDNAPVFAGASATIAENAAVGTQVAALSATDADGDALTWAIVSGNSDYTLNTSTGIITVAKALDFETTPAYTLLVRASDGTHNTDANVTITVTDINENPDPQDPVVDTIPPWNGNPITVTLTDPIGRIVKTTIWNLGSTLRLRAAQKVSFSVVLAAVPESDWFAEVLEGTDLSLLRTSDGFKISGNLAAGDTAIVLRWALLEGTADTLTIPVSVSNNPSPVLSNISMHVIYTASQVIQDFSGDGPWALAPDADRIVFTANIADSSGTDLQWSTNRTSVSGALVGNKLTLTWNSPESDSTISLVVSNAYGQSDTLEVSWTYDAALAIQPSFGNGAFSVLRDGSGRATGFSLPTAGLVEITRVDLQGKILNRSMQSMAAGDHWLPEAQNLAQGQFVRIRFAGQSLVLGNSSLR